MKTLAIDIETYSSVSLQKAGVYAYAASPDFEILLFGYAWDDGPVAVIDMAQGQKLPQELQDALYDPEILKTAFNASFERTCLSAFMGRVTPADQWSCTAVMARELGLPGSLEAVGEVIGLRWEDCDFEKKTISINHNTIYRKYKGESESRFHITTPKTKAGIRMIPMLSDVKNALLAEYNLQQQIGFCDEIIDGYSGFVFQNRFGSLLSSNDINRALERIYTACNNEERERAKEEKRPPVLIRHFSVHNLRHTFCTRFCENESNLKVIQEIMGHADIETTMNIYAEATTEKKVESFANLEGKIKIS